MLNRHQQKTLATKAKLFEAAQCIIAKRGFERATIDQIAKRAGFSRGAFYAHFNNKEDLFLALVQQRALEQLPQFCLQLQTGNDEQSPALLWQLYKRRLRNSEWSFLLIEFKLYVARRGRKRMSTARQLQGAARKDGADSRGILPGQGSRNALFEALADGLCLQRAYNKHFLSDAKVELIMRQAFDLFCDGLLANKASAATRIR